MSRLADALVLTMTRGVGLGDWHRLGLIEREWALYERMGECYPRILIVSFGGCEDELLAHEYCPRSEVICNAQGLGLEQFESVAPGLVSERLGDATTVVVKTNQMEGGSLACDIAESLREDGRSATLIARGGYPYSRFVAEREGTDSPPAKSAASEEARLCAAASMIICTTREMADDLAWRHQLDGKRFSIVPNYVVPNYVETDYVVAGDRADEGGRDPCEILYAGQLIERKRVELLIEGVATVDATLGASLSIIGDGPSLGGLKTLASERGVRATFEPRVSHRELRERMAGCAIYAQASALEGHPKTILEAMGAGCAVVACDAPGTRGVIQSGMTGLLVSGDGGALGAAIDLLLRDPALREKLGRAAREWAHKHVSLGRVFEIERVAHRDAIARPARVMHGESAPSAVRFDPALLGAPLGTQVAGFANAIGGFWKRLEPRAGARFVMALDDPFYRLQGHAAIVASDGLHPKHELTRYHDFFCERIRDGERVLDLGSGVGALAVDIAERTGARVIGMDFNPKNIALGEGRAKAGGVDHLVRFHLGDITTELTPGQHDVIVLSNVLEHLKDRAGLLAGWRETYACEKFLIRVPMFERDWRVPWKKRLGVEWRLDDTHETEYVEEELRSDLLEAGLKPRDWITRWGEYWVRAEAMR